MDCPVDRENTGRTKGRGEGDIKSGRLRRRWRSSHVEINAGARPVVGCNACIDDGCGRLAIVPVRGIVACPHNKTDPVGVQGRIGHEGPPSRRNVVRRSTRKGRKNTAIGSHVMVPAVEFIRIPIRNSNIPHRGSQTQRRPSESPQVQRLACGHCDIRVFVGSNNTGAEGPEVIGARQHVGDGETATRSRLNPELVGQVLLLEIHPTVKRGQSNPDAHRRDTRVIGVAYG